MQPDPVRLEETRAWFQKAHIDLRAAGIDLNADPPLAEDALFHCQQAVEKALKGFLAWHDQPFRKTHSLVELGIQCVDIDSSLEVWLRKTASLSEYATKYRYPGDVIPATAEEANEALSLAKEVVEQILKRLPADIRS